MWLIAWNRAHADLEMPWFDQELFEMALAKTGLDTPAYVGAKATARRLAWDEGLGATLTRDHLDAVVVPTTGPAWIVDPISGDTYSGAGFEAAAVSGTPSLTVPMGEVSGLPVGLTFMGRPFAEAPLLAMGYAFEQKTHARVPPRFVPSVGF